MTQEQPYIVFRSPPAAMQVERMPNRGCRILVRDTDAASIDLTALQVEQLRAFLLVEVLER